MRCLACNTIIAPVLARLGSLHCHDCKKPGNVRHGGFNG